MSLACFSTGDPLPHELSSPAIPAMTPAQFDDSLRLSKEELELENALQLTTPQQTDLNIEMDSVKSPVETQVRTPLSSAFDTTNTSSETESSIPQSQEGTELIIDNKETTPAIVPLTSSEPASIKQKRAIGVVGKARPHMRSEDEHIEFQFEDADLTNVITQMAELFNVTFISDDAVSPLPKGAKALKGNKISFKTNKQLSKKEAWELFVTFMSISELALVPQAEPNIYRIVTVPSAQRSPIPTYIGVKPNVLPDSDQLVRYLYFVANIPVDTIKNIIDQLRSNASTFIVLSDLNAFVLTDRAYNIKSLMDIVTELDRVTLPQSMSVLKLRRAEADTVKKLYDSILQGDQTSITARLFPARKESNVMYFNENVRMVAEKRTNALILLGPQDAIKKLEDFITKFVDIELGEETFSPLRVYQLKYADAATIVPILNELVAFGKGTPAGDVGGIRAGDKYFKPMSFTPETATNSIVVKGDEEDWLRIKEIIASIDTPQAQIAVEMLILTVTLDDNRQLGTQLRTKTPGGTTGLTGPNVKYQTSGIAFGGTPNSFSLNDNANAPGVQRLLGNLVSLVSNAGPGNTVVTLGSDLFGVWGIFNVLQKITNTQVVSNPFLIATNNQTAHIEVGEIRRVVSSTVITAGAPANSFSDNKAALTIDVKPQINSDGMIVLDLDIKIDDFTNPFQFNDATKTIRQVKTTTLVADKEILALGGLVKNTVITNTSQVPILGSIPILGWLFKNKQKEAINQSLLILISTHIIPPEASHKVLAMTKEKVNNYYGTLSEMINPADSRDIIHRSFFTGQESDTEKVLEDFIFKRTEIETPLKEKKNRKKDKNKKGKKNSVADTQQIKSSQNTVAAEVKTVPVPANAPVDVIPTAAKNNVAVPVQLQPTVSIAKTIEVPQKNRPRNSLSTVFDGNNEKGKQC